MDKIKVLQINAGSKNYGGVSSFLFNLYKNIDRTKYEFDFLTPFYTTYGLVKNDILELGGNVFELKSDGFWPIKKYKTWKNTSDFLKKNHYDIVHINSGSFFFNLMMASICKINKIENVVVHSHNGFNKKKLIKNFLIKSCLFALNNKCDLKLSCSYLAAESMFTKKSIKNDEVKIIKNGIEIDKFKYNAEIRKQYRNELGLNDKVVIGNIGRFVEQKNHTYLLKVFKEVLKKNSNAVLVLIGEGELEGKIRQEAKELNIDDKIMFLGKRSDVNNLLQCFDVLVMPSLYEGLPITSIEAQTSGLNLVVADTVTTELKINDNVLFIALEKSPNIWAEEILKINELGYNRVDAYQNVIKAGYTMEQSAKYVEELYDNLLHKRGL